MRVFVALCALLASAAAVAVDFPPMDYLKPTETFSAAKLTAAEVQEVLKQVKADTNPPPDSLQDELRVRHVSLGSVDGLVISGSEYFCSPTGNCTTWVFRRQAGHWVSMFLGGPPDAQRFGFERRTTHGFRNVVLSQHSSAFEQLFAIWTFNGKAYEPSRCYDVIFPVDTGGGPRTEVTPCN